jgi:hypothetical protein
MAVVTTRRFFQTADSAMVDRRPVGPISTAQPDFSASIVDVSRIRVRHSTPAMQKESGVARYVSISSTLAPG